MGPTKPRWHDAPSEGQCAHGAVVVRGQEYLSATDNHKQTRRKCNF